MSEATPNKIMSTTKTAFPSTVVALLAMILLLALLGMVQGQNYHYSNGWHPGKRMDGARKATPYRTIASENLCRYKPRILGVINKLIQEEIARVERSCSSEEPINHFKLLVEGLPIRSAETIRQNLDEAVAEAEDEAINKW